jgi:hypothetical protein
MPVWLIAVLPVISALLGVIVGNWGAARRETVSRLWEQRADTYLDVMTWALSVERTVATDWGEPYDLPSEDFQRLKMPDALLARMWAFASQPVLYAQGPCANHLFILAEGADRTPDEHGTSQYDESRYDLASALPELRNVIRRELSDGTLRVPMTFRLSQRIFSIRQPARKFLRHRKLGRARKRGNTSSRQDREANPPDT